MSKQQLENIFSIVPLSKPITRPKKRTPVPAPRPKIFILKTKKPNPAQKTKNHTVMDKFQKCELKKIDIITDCKPKKIANVFDDKYFE